MNDETKTPVKVVKRALNRMKNYDSHLSLADAAAHESLQSMMHLDFFTPAKKDAKEKAVQEIARTDRMMKNLKDQWKKTEESIAKILES